MESELLLKEKLER